MRNARALIALVAVALVACGGAAAAPSTAPATTAAATTAPAATRTSSPSPAATSAGGNAWTVGSASKATISVREQLVGVSLPSDAVLVATGATGSFVVNPDGSFGGDPKITFDVTTLKSDQSQRDNFVKQSTLETRRFPTATFVPTKATGLPLPLPTSGDFSFKLAGQMTIHGVTKDVTFTVTAKRAAGQLTATATADPSFKFGDFGMTAPAVPGRVVSVVDEIRVVVDLVATGPAS